MADDGQRVRLRVVADDPDQRVATGVIEALIGDRSRRLGEGRGDQCPGLLGPFCRRDQREIGNEPVMGHIGADHRRVGAAAFHKFAVAVALARLGALGFGMA